MNDASQRFAIAVMAGLREALNAAQGLARNNLHPRHIFILGQEQSFANSPAGGTASGPDAIGKLDGLKTGSSCIISLVYDSAAAPSVIAATSTVFGDTLQRYLLPEHARRLSGAVADGKFLVLAELHGVAEERSATRALLQNSSSIVEVHDLQLSISEHLVSLN